MDRMNISEEGGRHFAEKQAKRGLELKIAWLASAYSLERAADILWRKKWSNTFFFTPDRLLVGAHTPREDESGEHHPQPVFPRRVRQPVHSINPKGIHQSAAGLIAPPVILIAIIG